MTKQEVTAAQGDNQAIFGNSLTGALLPVTDAKLYVPVVTLSTQDDNKLLQ